MSIITPAIVGIAGSPHLADVTVSSAGLIIWIKGNALPLIVLVSGISLLGGGRGLGLGIGKWALGLFGVKTAAGSR